jgi:hypothetical protein
MKWVKVIYNLKNMMIQEFEHFVAFQLIQVMSIEMFLIQFESIVILIQVKLMKVIKSLKNRTGEESQHFEEFQLIQVMNMKMHLIQFESIMVPLRTGSRSCVRSSAFHLVCTERLLIAWTCGRAQFSLLFRPGYIDGAAD